MMADDKTVRALQELADAWTAFASRVEELVGTTHDRVESAARARWARRARGAR